MNSKGSIACYEVDLSDGTVEREIDLPRQLQFNPRIVVAAEGVIAGIDYFRRLVAFKPGASSEASVLSKDVHFVAAGGDKLCAIKKDKQVACFDSEFQSIPMHRMFEVLSAAKLSVGRRLMCTATEGRAVLCWDYGREVARVDLFEGVEVKRLANSSSHVCALNDKGRTLCDLTAIEFGPEEEQEQNRSEAKELDEEDVIEPERDEPAAPAADEADLPEEDEIPFRPK